MRTSTPNGGSSTSTSVRPAANTRDLKRLQNSFSNRSSACSPCPTPTIRTTATSGGRDPRHHPRGRHPRRRPPPDSAAVDQGRADQGGEDRKSTRLNSSHLGIS